MNQWLADTEKAAVVNMNVIPALMESVIYLLRQITNDQDSTIIVIIMSAII
jgi:hypothetical protein